MARWLFDRDISHTAAAKALGTSQQSISRYCREFGHADRQIPGEEMMARIVKWTRGEITPADFYPPHLRGGETAPAPAEAAS